MLTQMGSTPKIKIGSSYLKKVVKTKSLGLIIDDNLRWEEHIHYICSKTKRSIGIISRTKSVIPTGSSIQLYKSYVEPYFRYGNTVWRLCNDKLIHKLKLLQTRVVRMITDTSYDSGDHPLLLTELGWLNIRQLITFDLGIFIFKTNRGMTPQSVITCLTISVISIITRLGAPCRIITLESLSINRLQKLQILTVGQNSGMTYQDQSETLLLLRHLKKRFRELLLSQDKDTFCF